MSGGLVVPIKVSPGARREGVGGVWTDARGRAHLVVRVAAAPEDGKANKAACAAVAAALGLPKSAVAVTAGAKSRLKTLSIAVADDDAFRTRLAALMKDAT